MTTEQAEETGVEYRMIPSACLLETSAADADVEQATADSDVSAPWLAAQPEDDMQATLDKAVEGARADLGIEVGVAVRNRDTGETVLVNDQRSASAASLSKVVVAMSFLRQQDAAGQELPAGDRALLADSISKSGNESTAVLFGRLGPDDAAATDALADTYDLLGTEDTVPELGWGAESTTASDQLKVVDALADPPDWLGAEDAALLRSLMSPTPGYPSYSQGFGLGVLANPAVVPEGSVVEGVTAKNGWLADDDGQWSVSTIGQARVDGTPYEIVFTTHGAPNSPCGFTLLDDLTLLVADKA
ncbi:hypothetical protein GWK18_11380 [Kocuria sp. JC486]|uniref:serine hydrolase n=1 Tax=Kocuria sp. JC486 TaxID=1970736 RepID=UPI00141F9E0A|nr:serine hydrolase [Kocuria sp. JC486]NHU86174.1 hypothetical protein [Kocuria sp. JC486]